MRLEKLTMPERYAKACTSFWDYCKLINPKFFKDSRAYLHRLADKLQALYEGKLINPITGKPYKKMMINIPPRHGKSYILTLFCQWVFGRDNTNRIISVSYNETLAGRFARNVRDGIDATKIDPAISIFSDVFPETRIKYGDASMQIWALVGQFFSYLAAGFGGTITGVGCSIGIIDDPIKNDQEAYNDRVLDEQWSWYCDTFLSRIEEGGIQILNMTRWSTKDLCGKILDSEDASEWYVLCEPAYNEATGKMLCGELLSLETYQKKKRLTSPAIMDANYQQKPVDIEGRLYTTFRTYSDLPDHFRRIISYTDTADTGSDYLCSIAAGEYEGRAYVLDVIYTQKPMESTEPMTAKQLHQNAVNLARIESNNGGRGFARNVERLLWTMFGDRRVKVDWFCQTKNKKSRILSGSTNVMQNVLMPEDWDKRWSEYYKAMTTYQAAGSNAHDDAPDCTTGIAETLMDGHSKRMRTMSKSRLGL